MYYLRVQRGCIMGSWRPLYTALARFMQALLPEVCVFPKALLKDRNAHLQPLAQDQHLKTLPDSIHRVELCVAE